MKTIIFLFLMLIATISVAQVNQPGSSHNWDSTSLTPSVKSKVFKNYISDEHPEDRFPYINIIIKNLVSSDSLSIFNIIETGDTLIQTCKIDSLDLSKQLFTGHTGVLSLLIKNNNMHGILVKLMNVSAITGRRPLIRREIRYEPY
jgi:hypothetical protein